MKFDSVIIGGGHAGIEAALACARMGASTAMVTFSKDTIGAMSCNPAIGGLGKGQLVKEIDALFGEMGLAIDETGIQFRTLNASKGPAVRSSRAQADGELYSRRMIRAIEQCPNLTLIEGEVSSLVTQGNKITGIYVDRELLIEARAVVITSGTFLKGLMHTGEKQTVGGRFSDKSATTLSDSLRDLGLNIRRLKTGTPARLSKKTIDFSRLIEQPGDDPIRPFSFRNKEIARKQISCWLTSTNEKTHEIIRRNRDRSPLFNGQIQSGGPRYCPSIEDKVYRFADKNCHHIFLEPEGYESNIVYPNGISTSLPADVQEEFIRSIEGLEQAEIIRHGYAVEYDFVDPRELNHALKIKSIEGLYCAGQINGTSGYEEAGAQGIIAGINAALFVQDKEPFTLQRSEAYIAVMIDDLVTLGVLEPYRMFTSRAEYRLHLREDNAASRLSSYARKLGLISDTEWNKFCCLEEQVQSEKERLFNTYIMPSAQENEYLSSIGSAEISDSLNLATLLRRPEISYFQLCEHYLPDVTLSSRELERIETEIKFEGYLKRQEQDIERMRRMEDVKIPTDFSYDELKALSIEVRERLNSSRPETLGQAARLSGVTPAAVSAISIVLRRYKSSTNQIINV
ncbi:MAG: tRNA uridine-5-carboxymethylaminomethyl(34) synthesis enzyme MnmG [Deltaproteobacteria bacterium]|nr:tRNA uridine-5-carboxymethylaminomethyl(34) synthesis enzyme MnmG [Deltaproteobacteria bacterium]